MIRITSTSAKKVLFFAIVLALLAAPRVHAAITSETVTSVDMKGWSDTDQRGAGVGMISPLFSSDGDGAYQLTTTGPNDKANAEVYWDGTTANNRFGAITPIGSLNSWSYDVYRDTTSTSGDNSAPANRIYFTLNGSFSSLVFEVAYQTPNTIASGSFYHFANLATTGLLWLRTAGVNNNAAGQEYTLAQWLNPNFNKGGLPSIDPSTIVFGNGISFGSGVPGVFNGSIDHAGLVFGSNGVISDFSVAPEPSTWAMLAVGAALCGTFMYRRGVGAWTA